MNEVFFSASAQNGVENGVEMIQSLLVREIQNQERVLQNLRTLLEGLSNGELAKQMFMKMPPQLNPQQLKELLG